MPSPDIVAKFIQRWSEAPASERANYVMFLSELCDLLGVPRPDPAGPDAAANAYVFERPVTFHHRGTAKTTTGRVDLYKRGCFVLEAKQYAAGKAGPAEFAFNLADDAPKSAKIARGSAAWDRAMLEALGQAERYARSLPDDEDPPPFLLVVDVGNVIELYSDFTQKGKNYLPFPDSRSHRIKLADLADSDLRERLRQVWLTPAALDPAKISAQVTRKVAAHLAELAKSFEKRHEPKLVAEFLSRCLFCMFAEDVGLLPKESFRQLLESVKSDPGAIVPMMKLLFEDMNEGRFSGLLKKKLLYFNGGLFASAQALPVTGTQLGLLRQAAALEWRHVEPAIFGTLLERALSPGERHKLGAHYTPRAYVERLVLPTVIEPLREEWAAVRIAAVTLAQRGENKDIKEARATVREFHDRLCKVRVLDPACGSGNFLYVALEQLKRLEGEVITLLRDLGETDVLALQGVTVDPHQFLGLEINPRAAAIAELVLWIGYLQWHFRVHGEAMPAEPVLRKFNNIECRDAVLAYDKKDFAKDEHGKTRFVWDRRTMKTDPVTGREVPDDKAVIPLEIFTNPCPAQWPQADFIVGNPPFLGKSKLREDLGDGYAETLRAAYENVPDSADFVMFWWHKAAEEVLAGRAQRFGFITTNSIKQTFNRRVVKLALDQGVSLRFAIPDHPWVENADGAAVRIAMSVGALSYKLPEPGILQEPPPPDPSALAGDLLVVRKEAPLDDGSNDVEFAQFRGRISSDFTIGAELAGMSSLKANEGLTSMGVMLAGSGFILTEDEARELSKKEKKAVGIVIRHYRNGKDLTDQPRRASVIDFCGLTAEEARDRFPRAYEVVLSRVKPERDGNRDEQFRQKWWLFGRVRPDFRALTAGVHRYIVTAETTKHRLFQFLPSDVLADHSTIAFGLDDAFYLGVLSCCIHVVYAVAAGGRLGVGNDPRYNKSRCFDPFPFPDCTEKQKERIRKLAEELDAHRKRAQAKHGLGLTDIYNVLEKIRLVGRGVPAEPSVSPAHPEGSPYLSEKEKRIHDAALVSTHKQLHDDLDQAVADAYGWTWPLTDAEILEKVVALNAARAAEEAKGNIRWLRPDYQKPLFAGEKQSDLGLETVGAGLPRDSADGRSRRKAAPTKKTKAAWPATLADRAKAVELALAHAETPQTAAALARQFNRAKEKDVLEILQTLTALSRAHEGDTPGTYVR
ncbi:MAG: class I SAM-dependent DNA methyltransferase [Opitutae bacterium]|nr:class I SAM-dependent DNA methyltransferase [Opitutae bacterium]